MSKTSPSRLKKAIAIALALAVPIFIKVMLGFFIDIYDDLKYTSFYDWEIIGGRSEEIGDNVYRVILTLKNHSAYRVTLYDYDIQVTCNGKRVDKINAAFLDSHLMDCLKTPILPAGQTTEYSFDIALPQNAEFITLEYYGMSYTRQDYLHEESQQRAYSLEL